MLKTKLLFLLLLVANINSFTKEVVTILNYSDNTDLTQTDPKLGLPKEGLIQCGPVAVINSFIGLQKNGYPNLGRIKNNSLENYKSMILELSDYMGVLKRGGAPTKYMIYGIDKYVKNSGYDYKSLKSYLYNYNFNTIKSAVDNSSSIYLLLRWFEPNGKNKLKESWMGHWITIIGYENRGNELYLYANDPSPYAGDDSPNVYKIEQIESDLVHPSGRNYFDYYELVDFYKPSPEHRAIIVGIIELKMWYLVL